MAEISHERLNNIAIFRVTGTLSFAELVVTIESYYPRINCHILWDLTDGEFGEITEEQFNRLPFIVKGCMADREHCKNAYVSPDDKDYGILRMYQAITRYRCMPFESNVFRQREAALAWLC